MRTLLIVDVQYDFCEGGALPVQGGFGVADRVGRFLADHAGFRYDRVVASRDVHLPDSCNGGHFAREGEEPDYVLTFPPHCLADTPGSLYAFDPTLVSDHVTKGKGEPAFSLLEGWTVGATSSPAMSLLRRRDTVDVCGLTTDYCVMRTVFDALALECDVTLLADLVAGVDYDASKQAIGEMVFRGANVRHAL